MIGFGFAWQEKRADRIGRALRNQGDLTIMATLTRH